MRSSTRITLLLAGSLLLLTACADAPGPISLSAHWAVLENNLPEGGFRASLTLENTGTVPLPADGWALYFSLLRKLDEAAAPPSVEITNRPGDFYRLTPTESFEALAPGQRVELPLRGEAWIIKESESPAGLYLVVGGEATPISLETEPFRTAAQTTRNANDRMPVTTAASRYVVTAALPSPPEDPLDRITPTPVRVTPNPGAFVLAPSVTIHHDAELSAEAEHLVRALASPLGATLETAEGRSGGDRPSIELRIGEIENGALASRLSREAYRLDVRPEGISLTAPGSAGVFYGIQTLRALLPLEAWPGPSTELPIPAVTIVDAPGLAYRGLHLDVSRNFQPKSEVLRLLEAMSFYRLNRFHFHLTDDEGWRLEIEGLPELTGVGARRGHTEDERDHLQPAYGSGPDPDASPGSGHYSRADFIEILQFADAHHIEVVPEIDVPGHARAAIKAMEARVRRRADGGADDADRDRLVHPEDTSTYRSVQGYPDNVLDVCLPSTYRFLSHVIDDVIEMYGEAEVPLSTLHVGGDEVPPGVWAGSPACESLIAETPELESADDLAAYFFSRLRSMLRERGLAMAGWEEVALVHEGDAHDGDSVRPNLDLAGPDVVPYVWNNVWTWGREEIGYALANAGYPVVLANATHLYFDMAYNKDPEEPGYYWASFGDTRSAFVFLPFDLYRSAEIDVWGNALDPATYEDALRLTDSGRQNIQGIQGQLWGETLGPPERLAYLTFPKLLGLAERAWNPEPAWAAGDLAGLDERRDAAWSAFAARVGRWELPRLDHLAGGFGYRLPPPGAVLRDGLLYANSTFPGLTIRYTTDGTQPTTESPVYESPPPASGPVHLRTFDRRGRGSRPAVARESARE